MFFAAKRWQWQKIAQLQKYLKGPQKGSCRRVEIGFGFGWDRGFPQTKDPGIPAPPEGQIAKIRSSVLVFRLPSNCVLFLSFSFFFRPVLYAMQRKCECTVKWSEKCTWIFLFFPNCLICSSFFSAHTWIFLL